MHFHFQLANHYYGGLYMIDDIVSPVVAGLRAQGHTVTMDLLPDLPTWPSVIVLLEFFYQDHIVDSFLQWKTAPDARKCVGLICTEDIHDKLVMEHPDHIGRDRNLLRVLPHCEFVWPMVPSDYHKHVAADRLSFLDFGYVEALRRDGLPPQQRDIDVLLYGSINDRRRSVLEKLEARGLKVAATRGMLPDYMRDSLIARSRVVLDMRRGDDVKFASPTRICAALQMGATVVSEKFDSSRLSFLYPYTYAAPFEGLVETAAEIARRPDCIELGLAARERFARETSMIGNLERAMRLPVFAELAGATGGR